MNEVTNFCDGNCQQTNNQTDDSIKYKLHYTPTGRDLEAQSLPLDSKQGDNGQYSQIDTHSLYSTQQTKATFEYFKGI